jgi:hypothetical protein
MGYPIIPIRPGTKAPVESGWTKIVSDETKIHDWIAEGKSAWGVGVLARHVPAIDLDTTDETLLQKLVAWCDEHIGETLHRVGRAPRMLLPYRAAVPFKKMTSTAYQSPDGEKHQVEILGAGNQFVAYAIHPDTGRPYTWPTGDLTEMPLDMLPEITAETAHAFISFFESIVPPDWTILERGHHGNDRIIVGGNKKIARATLASLLEWLPAADDYNEWVRLSHAIKGASADYPEDGQELFHQWSAKSVKYESDAAESLWDSIKEPIDSGAGTLIVEAQKHGWTRPTVTAADDFDPVEGIQEPSAETKGKIAAWAEWRRSLLDAENVHREHRRERRVLSYSEMSCMPEPEWLVEGIIQKRSAALMFGRSNTFKSFLGLDLALSVATGQPWHGAATSQGRVLVVATEGANGVGRMRVPGWYSHHRIPLPRRQDLFLFPSEISLDVGSDVSWLIEQINQIGDVSLLVLDIFGGTMNGTEVEDTTARAWVRAVQRIIAETGASVLTIAHTGWSDDTRARMHTHFWGSFDSRLRVEGDKDHMTTCLAVERHKDADSAGVWGFRLEKTHGTLVPVVDETVHPIKGAKWTKPQTAAMRALDSAISAVGETKSGEGWPACRVVPLQVWREYCDQEGLTRTDTDSARRMAFKRAREDLHQKKAIHIFDDHVWGDFEK